MEFTKNERIVLINQYEILKRLDKENADIYGIYIDVLKNGYSLLYDDINKWLMDDMPHEYSEFVFEILLVYRSIEDYKRKNPEDRKVADHPFGHFPGFDLDNEGHFWMFSLFLFYKYKWFSEQLVYREATDDFNSHFPHIEKYCDMIGKWNELGKKLDNHEAVMSVLEP